LTAQRRRLARNRHDPFDSESDLEKRDRVAEGAARMGSKSFKARYRPRDGAALAGALRPTIAQTINSSGLCNLELRKSSLGWVMTVRLAGRPA
jgi:hypothetical protein